MGESNQIYGRIYRITSDATNNEYIGSTTQTLKQRLAEHSSKYKKFEKNHLEYATSFEIIKHGNAKISSVHEGLFNTRKDLCKMETHFIKTSSSCVNKAMPTRTRKEYRSDHKDYFKEYGKNYYAMNKKHITEKNKLYRENHFERFLEYQKDYKEINKERLLEKHTCEVCGGAYATKHKSTHEKTSKHVKSLNKSVY